MFRIVAETRRRLVAAVAALAMVGATVVSTAAPAKADPSSDDIARALAAIAALAIIANAANGDDRPAYRPPYYQPPYQPYQPPYGVPYRPPYQPPYHAPQPKPPTHGAKVLPDACRVAVVNKENRRDVYYTQSCLRRAGVDRLPASCQTEVKLNGDRVKVYRDNCLFNNGFRTAYR